MARVIWTNAALTEVQEACEFQARTSAEKAVRLHERIQAAVRHLAHSPRRGRVVPEFGIEHLRELIVPPHRILYYVRGDDCLITHVKHSSQNLTQHVFPDDETD